MADVREGPDDRISLARAAELSGRNSEALRVHAVRGRLCTVKIGNNHLTTRRWLHEYLKFRDPRQQEVAPLPAEYQAPE